MERKDEPFFFADKRKDEPVTLHSKLSMFRAISTGSLIYCAHLYLISFVIQGHR